MFVLWKKLSGIASKFYRNFSYILQIMSKESVLGIDLCLDVCRDWLLFLSQGGVVPTMGITQVPVPPFLGIPRFCTPLNGYSLLFSLQSLEGCLADGGQLVLRWCQNFRWCIGTVALFELRDAWM